MFFQFFLLLFICHPCIALFILFPSFFLDIHDFRLRPKWVACISILWNGWAVMKQCLFW
jgi:hypothetical protein